MKHPKFATKTQTHAAFNATFGRFHRNYSPIYHISEETRKKFETFLNKRSSPLIYRDNITPSNITKQWKNFPIIIEICFNENIPSSSTLQLISLKPRNKKNIPSS